MAPTRVGGCVRGPVGGWVVQWGPHAKPDPHPYALRLAAYHPSGSLRSSAYCRVTSAGARGAAMGSRVGSCLERHAWWWVVAWWAQAGEDAG